MQFGDNAQQIARDAEGVIREVQTPAHLQATQMWFSPAEKAKQAAVRTRVENVLDQVQSTVQEVQPMVQQHVRNTAENLNSYEQRQMNVNAHSQVNQISHEAVAAVNNAAANIKLTPGKIELLNKEQVVSGFENVINNAVADVHNSTQALNHYVARQVDVQNRFENQLGNTLAPRAHNIQNQISEIVRELDAPMTMTQTNITVNDQKMKIAKVRFNKLN